jgi:hypothetical protein
MVSFMPFWKNSISIFLCLLAAACASTPPAFVVGSASIDAGALAARLQWRPDARVLEALDHGIALQFDINVQAQGAGLWPATLAAQTRHVQLRYFPLSRQYQLRDLDLNQARSFAARALALAALEDLRLPLPDWKVARAERYRLQIALNRDALPGALRLPALLQPAWRRCNGEYAWPARAG